MPRPHNLLFILFLLLVAAAPRAAAQKAEWEARYGSPQDAYEEVRAAARDASGHTVLTGTTWAGDDNDYDVLTVRVSPTGQVLWARTFNGRASWGDAANAVATDADGNVYVAGLTWQGYELGEGTDYDYLLLKYSPTGELLWSRTYDGTSQGYDEVYALAVDAQGSAIVTGMSWGRYFPDGQETNHGDYLTIKFAPDGTPLWTRRDPGPTESGGGAYDLVTDAEGSVYITGSAIVMRDGYDQSDILTIKYSEAGDKLWESVFDGGGVTLPDDTANRIALDPSGNVFVAGSFWPGEGDTREDALLLKIDPAGALQWSRSWGFEFDDGTADLAVDSAGNAIVTGTFLRFDETLFWETADAFVLKYDPAGVLLWEADYNGPMNDDELYPRIALGPDDAVHLSVSTPGSNGYDIALIKYGPVGEVEWNRLYNGPGNESDYPQNLFVDAAGDLILGATSGFGGSLDFLALKYLPSAPVDGPSVKSLTLAPARLTGGTDSTATITLSGPAPAGGAFVEITFSHPDFAYAPGIVSVAGGQSEATFTINTTGVPAVTEIVFTAKATGDPVAATLTIDPPVLQEFEVWDPNIVGGNVGQGVVWLNGIAPDPGADVALTSSNPDVASVDPFVTVPGGDLNMNASFAIRTTGVSEPVTVQITASYNGVSILRDVTVLPATLQYIAFNPSYGPGGGEITGYVALDGAAPEGGLLVTLDCSDRSLVDPPASILVPAGESFASFEATTFPVREQSTATITATDGVTTLTADVTIRPPVLRRLSLNPEGVVGGNSVVAQVRLDGPAPKGGLEIKLTSSHPEIAPAPAVLIVPEFAVLGSVTIPTALVSDPVWVTLTAQDSVWYTTRTAMLAVVPPGEYPDTLTVTTARYVVFRRARRVYVEAISSAEFSTLKVHLANGDTLGTLYHIGGGRFRGYVTVQSRPDTITVKSSFGAVVVKEVTD